MIPWTQRPPEVANHLNPAFCSTLLAAAASGYTSKDALGMPVPLMFVVLPLVLHAKTAELIPGSSVARFSNWVYGNRSILLGLQERVRQLVPFTREAVLMGFASGSITLIDNRLVATDAYYARIRAVNQLTNEKALLARRAGIMIAGAGSPATVFALLGVAP